MSQSAEPRERKPHPGRKPLPENLPRIEEVIACDAELRTLRRSDTRVIGYDTSEVLDREPAKWFVRVTKREKRACGKCSAVQMAGARRRASWKKGWPAIAVVIETVVAKYCDHLPLYRQEAMLEREAGVEISRATLDGWVMRVGELLRAGGRRHARRSAARILYTGRRNDCAGADARWSWRRSSGVFMAIRNAFNGRAARRCSIFNWAAAAMVRAKFLKDWNGILQTDGYQAYDQVGGPGLIHVGCWAHARRKFVDAVKVNPKDGAAIAMVTRMDALFLVDRHARQQTAWRGRTRCIAPRTCAAVGGRDSFRVREAALATAAEKRVGRSGELHLKYVAETAAVFRSRRGRVVQQCGGELDAAGRAGTQELAARGQREVRTQGRGDSLGGGILPPAACPVKEYLLAVLPGMNRR